MRLFAIIVCAVLFMGFQEKDEPEQGVEIRTDGRSCLFAPLALVPDHNPVDARCDFINKISEEERELNSPKNPAFKGFWGNDSNIPARMALKDNILEQLNLNFANGESDKYSRLVLLDEDVETNRALFFVIETYDLFQKMFPQHPQFKPNKYQVLLLIAGQTSYGEPVITMKVCEFFAETQKPINELNLEELKSLFLTFVANLSGMFLEDPNFEDVFAHEII